MSEISQFDERQNARTKTLFAIVRAAFEPTSASAQTIDMTALAPPPSHAAKAQRFTARMTIDVTPELRGHIEVTAFQRGPMVAEMPRDPARTNFRQTQGDWFGWTISPRLNSIGSRDASSAGSGSAASPRNASSTAVGASFRFRPEASLPSSAGRRMSMERSPLVSTFCVLPSRESRSRRSLA